MVCKESSTWPDSFIYVWKTWWLYTNKSSLWLRKRVNGILEEFKENQMEKKRVQVAVWGEGSPQMEKPWNGEKLETMKDHAQENNTVLLEFLLLTRSNRAQLATSYCGCHDEIYHTTFCHWVVRQSRASLSLSLPTQRSAHTIINESHSLSKKDSKLSAGFPSNWIRISRR